MNLTQHLPFKIVSVLLALVLYLFVMQDQEGVRELIVPVAVNAEPDDFVLLTEIPDLRVLVAGRTRNLARLGDELLPEIELSFDRIYPHWRFSPADIRLPGGLEVVSIIPESIDLHFAPKLTREVPIIVDMQGQPPTGYNVTASTSPPTLRVDGPASVVEALQEVRTQSVDVSTLREDTVQTVVLERLDSRVHYDRDIRILVSFHMEINWANVRVSDVPVLISGPEGRFALDREFVSVRLRGPQTVIDNMDRALIRASVDALPFLTVPAGTYDVEPALIGLPTDVTVEEIDFQTLRLTVSAPPSIEFRPIPLPNFLPLPLPYFVPG